jgi:hypothetical protein
MFIVKYLDCGIFVSYTKKLKHCVVTPVANAALIFLCTEPYTRVFRVTLGSTWPLIIGHMYSQCEKSQ